MNSPRTFRQSSPHDHAVGTVRFQNPDPHSPDPLSGDHLVRNVNLAPVHLKSRITNILVIAIISTGLG